LTWEDGESGEREETVCVVKPRLIKVVVIFLKAKGRERFSKTPGFYPSRVGTLDGKMK